MSGVQSRKGDVIVLTYSARQITVEPENEDRFGMTARKAVQACVDRHREDQAMLRFKQDFLRPVRDWCERHADTVKGCYIPDPVGFVQVFVVTTSSRFDFDLGAELAALELQLFDAGWRASVTQLPDADDAELATFFNPKGAIEVYADRQPA